SRNSEHTSTGCCRPARPALWWHRLRSGRDFLVEGSRRAVGWAGRLDPGQACPSPQHVMNTLTLPSSFLCASSKARSIVSVKCVREIPSLINRSPYDDLRNTETRPALCYVVGV